jgi:hypothetical protein
MATHTANTPAEPPSCTATPSKPKLKLPPGACDAHVHVFGPRARLPFAEGRSYTPSDAPKETLFARQALLADNPQRFYRFGKLGPAKEAKP